LQLYMCIYFFCNGVLPSFVMQFSLINEETFILILCVFILYALKIMTIANRLDLL